MNPEQTLVDLKGPGWTHILSHLNLVDLHSFAHSHLRMADIVDQYLSVEQNPVTIDSDTLCRSPIGTHEHLYIKYGARASHLVVDGIPGGALRLLLRYFQNIRQLTLIHITLDGDVLCKGSCPFLLRKLCLLNNKSHVARPIEGLSRIRNLRGLYLRGNDLISLENLPRLQSLTVLNQNLELPHLKCPSLTSLTVDHLWPYFIREDFKKMPQLKHLRVLDSVDWMQKEEIDALQIKNLQLDHYPETPAAESWIMRLNDYCLLHLAKFLPHTDWIELHELHPRREHLPVATLYITQKTLERRPIPAFEEFYARVAPHVSVLHVGPIPEAVHRALMPMFTRLKELSLDMSRNCDLASWVPEGLRKLSLNGEMMDDRPSLSALFRKLNTSLQVLSLQHPRAMDYEPGDDHMRGLAELTHIQEFECDFFKLSGECLLFLEQNKDTLSRLEIYIVWAPELNAILSSLVNLKRLKMFVIEPDFSDEFSHDWKDSSLCLPMLEELSIVHIPEDYSEDLKEGTIQLLRSLDGTHLRSFSFYGHTFAIKKEVFQRLGNLVHFSLDVLSSGEDDESDEDQSDYCDDSEDDQERLPEIHRKRDERFDLTTALLMLPKLESLTVKGIKCSDFFALVKGLPRLSVLNAKGFEAESTVAVRELLKLTNRKLCLNGSAI